MLKIEGHVLKVMHNGTPAQIDLPLLPVAAKVAAWAVPTEYRENGFFVAVTPVGQPSEIPACDPREAVALGSVEYPASDAAILNAAREEAHASIEKWRDTQENAAITFEHAGATWDGGLTTRTRLQPVVRLPALPDGFFWTDHDNNDVPMTLEQLQALDAAHEQAIVLRGFQIHATQRALKQSLQTMSLEQLREFDANAAAEALAVQ